MILVLGRRLVYLILAYCALGNHCVAAASAALSDLGVLYMFYLCLFIN